MAYFNVNNLFFDSFPPRMSCDTELLYTVDHWTKVWDNGNDADIIHLVDFHKVFDCVLHQHLLSKLYCLELDHRLFIKQTAESQHKWLIF